MSILIKGMEMPKNCGECPFIFSSWGIEYYCHLAESSTSAEYVGQEKMTNCPLIELPPHGRLGDLDKLWDRMYNYIDNEGAKMPFGDNDFMIHRDSACELIEDAPTVIEGSET